MYQHHHEMGVVYAFQAWRMGVSCTERCVVGSCSAHVEGTLRVRCSGRDINVGDSTVCCVRGVIGQPRRGLQLAVAERLMHSNYSTQSSPLFFSFTNHPRQDSACTCLERLFCALQKIVDLKYKALS